MMRGELQWSLAVRRPDGAIEVDVHDNPRFARRYEGLPLLRGVAALGESMALGLNALRAAVNKAAPADRQMSRRGMVISAAIAVPLAISLFLVLPALAARPLGSGSRFHMVDGLLRVIALVGYIAAIGRLADIRTVFEYHGAEHKSVAAYEAGTPLTAEAAVPFGTQHIRCGTNFLLTVVVVTSFVNALFGEPGWAALIALRVLTVPIVVALAYEWLRFAATRSDRALVRALLVPGLALQRLTTREPSLDQLEVAMAALAAVVPRPVRAVETGDVMIPALTAQTTTT
jgi:uncharacterized protein YqhQ